MTSSRGLGPLHGFRPPGAGELLKARVLARARSEAASCRPAGPVDRIWYSPRWRLAWALAMAGLLMLDVAAAVALAPALPTPPPGGPGIREGDAAAAELGLPATGWTGGRVVNGGHPGASFDEVVWTVKEGSP